MNRTDIKLTYVDRIILESYSKMLEGLSLYFGEGFEMVLHSLEDCSKSAIKVINGYHTGRKEGAPITDLALKMLEKIENNEGMMQVTYFSKNKKGEPLKSATIAIQGENERIIGLLCINFYLNTPLIDIVKIFSVGVNDTDKHPSAVENFSTNSIDLIEESLNEIRSDVYNDESISITRKNREIIKRLKEKGIYNIKEAVQITARVLGMSKNTVYMHLRNLED